MRAITLQSITVVDRAHGALLRRQHFYKAATASASATAVSGAEPSALLPIVT